MRIPSDEYLREREREETEAIGAEFDLGVQLFHDLPPRELLASIKIARSRGMELRLRPVVAHGYLFARDFYILPVEEVVA